MNGLPPPVVGSRALRSRREMAAAPVATASVGIAHAASNVAGGGSASARAPTPGCRSAR